MDLGEKKGFAWKNHQEKEVQWEKKLRDFQDCPRDENSLSGIFSGLKGG